MERDGNTLGPGEIPPPHPEFLPNPLLLPSRRLLDDFMPHKNDIKFVKMERRNDRYGPAVWSGRLRAGEKKQELEKKGGEGEKSKRIAECVL